jgi:hypothetical protein
VGERRVASAENDVRPEFDIEFLPKRGGHVDLGEYAEPLTRECLASSCLSLVERQFYCGTDAVSGGVLEHLSLSTRVRLKLLGTELRRCEAVVKISFPKYGTLMKLKSEFTLTSSSRPQL